MLNIEHKYLYFISYACIYVVYGALVTAVGPVIPFFTKVTGQDETYYAFIFMARAAGYVAGGVAVKPLVKIYSYHQIMVALVLIISISLILSSLSLTFINLSVWMFIAAAASCMISIVANLCIFKIFIGDRQDFWIQLIHTVFGVGGLLGPMLAIYFEEKGMMAIGVLMFFTFIPVALLKSPEAREDVRKSAVAFELSKKAQICICILFTFYIAEEVGLASWIPTYAIKMGVADVKQAGVLSSIFWMTNTAFRIILLYMPGTVTERLNLLMRGLVGSTFVLFVLQCLGYYTFVSYVGVFTSGMFIASMYALFLAISPEYGFKMTPSSTANAMMSASLGEGMLIMPIGYAMGYFGSQFLFIIMFLFSTFMYCAYQTLLATYDRDLSLEKEKDVSARLIESPKIHQ